MPSSKESATQTLFFDQALLTDGWARNVRLSIRAGRFIAVERDSQLAPDDERHRCALPGMSNLHSHAFQRAMAGLAERRGPSSDSFWTWRDVMYRFVNRITPDGLQAIAALAYIEMLESGFTRVGEFHYLHHDPEGRSYSDPAEMSSAIIAAAGASGIGLTLLPVLYSYSGFGALAPNEGQRRFVSDIDSYARLLDAADQAAKALPNSVVGIAPHSLRAVSPEQLTMLPQLSSGRPVHIHIAEQMREVEDCIVWSGQRPVHWLINHANVDDSWCLIHATHMNAEETVSMARTGATAGLCPITEANLGDGFFPAEAYLAAGGSYGIGSDSNVLIDCSEELRLLEYGQRLAHRGRNVMTRGPERSTGMDIYAGAIHGGARALGSQSGISAGQVADIVSLNLNHPSLAGKTAEYLLDGFIFAAGKNAIDCVWRYGEKKVVGGRHFNREEIAARYIAVLEKLIA